MGPDSNTDDFGFWESPLLDIINAMYRLNEGYLSADHVRLMDSPRLSDKLAAVDSGIHRVVFRGVQVKAQNKNVALLYLFWHGNVRDPEMLASAPMVDPEGFLEASSQVRGSKLVVVRDIRAATDVFRAPAHQLNAMRDYDLWIVNLARRGTQQKTLVTKLMLNRVFADARLDREVTLESAQELVGFMTDKVA